MNSIHMTIPPSSDGSLHLPIPNELIGAGKLRVVAWLEAANQQPAKAGAGKWAKEARGIVSMPHGKSADDVRLESLRYKFEGR
jgi:hypothetical protein